MSLDFLYSRSQISKQVSEDHSSHSDYLRTFILSLTAFDSTHLGFVPGSPSILVLAFCLFICFWLGQSYHLFLIPSSSSFFPGTILELALFSYGICFSSRNSRSGWFVSKGCRLVSSYLYFRLHFSYHKTFLDLETSFHQDWAVEFCSLIVLVVNLGLLVWLLHFILAIYLILDQMTLHWNWVQQISSFRANYCNFHPVLFQTEYGS